MNHKDVNIGIKIGPKTPKDYLQKISDELDFVEIYAKIGVDYDFVDGFGKPIVIHIPHFGDGINFANPHLQDKNQNILNHALELADRFESKKIIFHPELKEDESCNLEVLSNFITNNYDPRLLIESMPFSSMGFNHFATSVAEIKHLTVHLKIGFCLDFAHTAEYLTRKKAPLSDLKHYVELKPDHFHITDTDLSKVFLTGYNEEHLSLGEGDMDWDLCKSLLPAGSSITIETPTIFENQLREIKFLKS